MHCASSQGACRFVSEYITYEPLENPLHPPQNLPSPHSVLTWQGGDSFDCAVLLTSLLLDAGFDAYVVVGYAPRPVTLRDLTSDECLLAAILRSGTLDASKGASDASKGCLDGVASAKQRQQQEGGGGGNAVVGSGGAGKEGAAEAGGVGGGGKKGEELGKKKKYQLRPRPNFTSKFWEEKEAQAAAAGGQEASKGEEKDESSSSSAVAGDQAARRRSSGGDMAAIRRQSEVEGEAGLGVEVGAGEASVVVEGQEEEGEEEEGEGRRPSKRVHAWVLVLPGRRDVSIGGFGRGEEGLSLTIVLRWSQRDLMVKEWVAGI